MKYFKSIEDGYVVGIATGCGSIEITAEEYTHILNLAHNRPTPPEGYDYCLREDLTWELYELPPIDPAEEEISDSEALAIILGGGA